MPTNRYELPLLLPPALNPQSDIARGDFALGKLYSTPDGQGSPLEGSPAIAGTSRYRRRLLRPRRLPDYNGEASGREFFCRAGTGDRIHLSGASFRSVPVKADERTVECGLARWPEKLRRPIRGGAIDLASPPIRLHTSPGGSSSLCPVMLWRAHIWFCWYSRLAAVGLRAACKLLVWRPAAEEIQGVNKLVILDLTARSRMAGLPAERSRPSSLRSHYTLVDPPY